MAQFQVSRVTVRQAIGLLMEQNRLVVKQGKGTFVAGAHVTYHLQEVKGFYDTLVAQGLHPDTKLIEFAKTAAPRQFAALFGAQTRNLMRLRRTYSVAGRPMTLADLYLALDPARVSRQQAVEHPSYWLLEEMMGLKISRADVRIRVQAVGAETGRLLGLRAGTQALVMERISFGVDECPLEHATFFIRPEAYEFRLAVVGPLPIGSRISQADHFSPARKNGG
jgi:GntR family transcriptional regulator